MDERKGENLAVLIDADNAQTSTIRELLEEVARYGTASVKRAYGDWTTPQLGAWKSVLHELAIQPIQQFSYTKGKNATDSALIIDAMDLLHTGKLDGFCLVSSDSDFTRLATRIRDKFVYTEILKPEAKPIPENKQGPEKLEPMLRTAVNSAAGEDGWAPLSGVGSIINKNNPAFDPRNYGCQKLGDLVRQKKYLDVKEEPIGNGSSGVNILVRLKPKGSTSNKTKAKKKG